MAITQKCDFIPAQWVVHFKCFTVDPIIRKGSGVKLRASDEDVVQSPEQKKDGWHHGIFEMIAFVRAQETPAGDSQDWSEEQNCALAAGHLVVVEKPYKNCFVLPNLNPLPGNCI